jgi:PAS domain S-box-containing protein
VYRSLRLFAAITVPLVKSGRLVALLSVHQAAARTWTGDEVALVEEVAERTWAALERARAEAASRESQALLAAIMENAPIGMYLKDLEGRYVVANPEMARLFGRPVPEVIGRTAADLFGAEYARAIEQHDRDVLDSGRTITVEEHLPGADGYEWTLVMRFPVRTGPDAPLRVGGFDIDITAQKRAEAALERSRDALYQSEKLTALGSLLAGVSHELNNPLSIIVAQATLMELDAEGTSLASRAAKIRQAADRSARIVQTFLAMARQKRPERHIVNMNDVVRAALELTDYGLRTAGVQVVQDLSPDLQPTAGDADQLHQVLVNLIVNAQHAMQEGSGQRVLEIGTRNLGEEIIEISVRDTGPGVPPELSRRVFDPFFTTKPEGAGTGVGLSFSHGVIEAHGGRLELVSGQGGAEFVLSLPAASGPSTDPATSRVATQPAPARTALVVDDEPDIADALAELLRREGFDVVVAHGGGDAQARLDRGYDLVLSDIRMPDMDGPALFEWIEEHAPQLSSRVAFITGDTLSAAAVRFLARSGCPFVEKPFTLESLRTLIAEVGERAGTRP